jgi:hypothetical protein
MTKDDILTAITAVINDTATGFTSTEDLTQEALTELTDGIAHTLDTVNPNGPCYPSTPR